MSRFDAIDLFAGCGGWDLGARAVGLTTLGIEIEPYAVRTRMAANLPTRKGDVRAFGPDLIDCQGLIGSPPCQPFSRAGKQQGNADLNTILLQIAWLAQGRDNRAHYRDHRTELVTEPLRWALQAKDQGRPYTWVALEQVPAVLPVWRACARVLRDEGYSVVCDVLHCEQYGLPQTRERAVLIARLDERAQLPTPTHSRYYPHTPRRLDPGVQPWVTMAEALGWGMDARPSVAVTSGGTGTGGTEPFGNGSRQRLATEQQAGRWKVGFPRKSDGKAEIDGYRARDLRDTDLPAQAITEKTRSWSLTRPSTTVVGSFRPEAEAAPGWRVSPEDGSRQDTPGSVRVSPEEASILQGFPPDHPWRGPRTRIYEQIGNAFPPPVASAVLRCLRRDQ